MPRPVREPLLPDPCRRPADGPHRYGDRTAKLEKALDICCNTEKKLVVTTDKDGATSEEFTTYLLDTLKSL